MIWLVAALVFLGWYLGVGTALGVWSYIDDLFDDPWGERLIISVLIAIFWGPVFLAIVGTERIE